MPNTLDTLHQILQLSIETGKIGAEFRALVESVMGSAMTAAPYHPASEAWIEAGHRSDSGAELRLAFADPLPTGHNPFWVPFSTPDGTALGWMQFSYLTTVRQKSQFAATAWRSAAEPAPPEQDVLPLPLDLLPAGFSPAAYREVPAMQRDHDALLRAIKANPEKFRAALGLSQAFRPSTDS